MSLLDSLTLTLSGYKLYRMCQLPQRVVHGYLRPRVADLIHLRLETLRHFSSLFRSYYSA